MAARTTPASDDTTTDAVDASDLTQFQTNILVILAEEARYGLAIKRALEEYYGEDINHGRLYPNLDTLVEDGLVAKSELDKRTNQYAITDDGRDVIEARLEWVEAHLSEGGDGE